MSTPNSAVENLLVEAEQEAGRHVWEGPFSEYLAKVILDPSVSRLSHRLVYDAILDGGATETPAGEPVYGIFQGKIFGLDESLDRIVNYFASAARRLEIRKRILLLLGPPASGKSSVADLIKESLERHTRTDGGAVYAIKGCPMQEEPLHLIPDNLRPQLMREYGIHIEGQLCPRCRYMFRGRYKSNPAKVPVVRVVFSAQEAVGIGSYVATNPRPRTELLVGSINDDKLEGDRLEVAGKAFRLDGEFNVANRGLVEFVEMFKADPHLLTALLGLSQEQLIKMERFGSVYADEVIIAHSNLGDFNEFMANPSSEALRDRIIAVQIPYNTRVGDEVKIYETMIRSSGLENVHVPPLTLPIMSVFAVLSRLKSPNKTAVSMLDKMRAYDGQLVRNFDAEDVRKERLHFPDEAMDGISPRYVMNRLSDVASKPEVACVAPLLALESLWEGLSEYLDTSETRTSEYITLIRDTVSEYNERATKDVQQAYMERFEETAAELLDDYLNNLIIEFAAEVERDPGTGALREADDRSMREMEKHIGVNDRERRQFRWDIHRFFTDRKRRSAPYDYTSEPRMKAAIDARLFPDRRTLHTTLSKRRSAKTQVEWARRRGAIHNRLVQSYGYCDDCAEDTVEYVIHVLKGRAVIRTQKNERIDWLWGHESATPPALQESEGESENEEAADD
jgi:serine protein kinase